MLRKLRLRLQGYEEKRQQGWILFFDGKFKVGFIHHLFCRVEVDACDLWIIPDRCLYERRYGHLSPMVLGKDLCERRILMTKGGNYPLPKVSVELVMQETSLLQKERMALLFPGAPKKSLYCRGSWADRIQSSTCFNALLRRKNSVPALTLHQKIYLKIKDKLDKRPSRPMS